MIPAAPMRIHVQQKMQAGPLLVVQRKGVQIQPPERFHNKQAVHHHQPPRQQQQQQPQQQQVQSQDPREEGSQFQWTVNQGIDTAEPFPRGRYTVHGLLGSGTYGRVLRCADNKYNQHPVAIKIVRKDNNLFHDAAKKEIKLLQDLNGLHGTIRLLRAFQFQGHICISFELLGDNLFNYLERNGNQPLPMPVLQDVGRQILESVHYIHQKNIIHTDFKTENILIIPSNGGSMKVKVIDFGSGLYSQDWHPPLVGTMQYRPPEMALQAGWSFPLDLWGIGCILAELYLGKQLFPLVHDDVHLVLIQKLLEAPIPQHILKIAASNLNQFNTPLLCNDGKGNGIPRLSPCRPDNSIAMQKRLRELIMDPLLLDLVQSLFALEPSLRPTASQALRFPFFDAMYQNESTSVAATQISELSHAETKEDFDDDLEERKSWSSVEDVEDDIILARDDSARNGDADHSNLVAHLQKLEAMRFLPNHADNKTSRDSFSSVEDYDPDDDLLEVSNNGTHQFRSKIVPSPRVEDVKPQYVQRTDVLPLPFQTYSSDSPAAAISERERTPEFSNILNEASVDRRPVRALERAGNTTESAHHLLNGEEFSAEKVSKYAAASAGNSDAKNDDVGFYRNSSHEDSVLQRKETEEGARESERMQDFRSLMNQVEQVLGSLERLSPTRTLSSSPAKFAGGSAAAASIASAKKAPELLRDRSKPSSSMSEPGDDGNFVKSSALKNSSFV